MYLRQRTLYLYILQQSFDFHAKNYYCRLLGRFLSRLFRRFLCRLLCNFLCRLGSRLLCCFGCKYNLNSLFYFLFILSCILYNDSICRNCQHTIHLLHQNYRLLKSLQHHFCSIVALIGLANPSGVALKGNTPCVPLSHLPVLVFETRRCVTAITLWM